MTEQEIIALIEVMIANKERRAESATPENQIALKDQVIALMELEVQIRLAADRKNQVYAVKEAG